MKSLIVELAMVVLFFSSCSKKGESESFSPEGISYPSTMKGNIYYDWATEGILKVSLPEGVGSSFIPDNRKLNNFDISRDGKYKLTVIDEQTLGQYDIRFTISDIAEGKIVEEFVYRSPGRNAYCTGFLSHDQSHILVLSNDLEDGVTILKRNGEFVTRLMDINGEPVDRFNAARLWLPGNALLLTHGNYIIKLNPPYTSGKLIKEMEHENWGELTVNHQGSQMAMQIANHIYTMDMEGNNLRQVTTSNFNESVPEFSPDGKHLLVGTEYKQTGPFGWMWYMKIIPNDGKQYHVDPIETNTAGVVPVILKGGDKIEAAGGQMLWR